MKVLLRALVAVTFALAAVCASLPARAIDFVFIKNQKNPTTTLSKQDVRSLFTGRTKQWGGLVAQTVVGEKDSSEFGYLASVFGTGTAELLARIQQEVFRGEMRRPVLARTPADCIDAVSRHAGGIGIIPEDASKGLPEAVVRIDVTE
jgi:hypothetical protein